MDIKSIPGIRGAHYFGSVEPYVIKLSKTALSQKNSFSFITGKTDQEETEPAQHDNPQDSLRTDAETQHNLMQTFQVGQWVDVKYDDKLYIGLILKVVDDQN